MKSLKLWQKAGLVAAIVGGLTLGGLTPKYDSKGLESKIPTIGMSVAEAKETKVEGYEIPDLTGYTMVWNGYVNQSEKILGKETYAERFENKKGDIVVKEFYKNHCFAYVIKKADEKVYSIVDSKCKHVYDEKYNYNEDYDIPECLL